MDLDAAMLPRVDAALQDAKRRAFTGESGNCISNVLFSVMKRKSYLKDGHSETMIKKINA